MSMGKKQRSINSPNYQSTKDEENEDDISLNSLFFGLFDDPEATSLRSGSMKRQYSTMGDNYHRVYEEQNDDIDYNGDGRDDDEASKMEVGLLMLLEYLRELYMGQPQVLKKMFPGGTKDKFLGFFNKIGDFVSQFKQDSRPPTRSMTMQRSLSAGSRRVSVRGLNTGRSDLRDERFKITTVEAGGAAGGGKGGSTAGQGQTKK